MFTVKTILIRGNSIDVEVYNAPNGFLTLQIDRDPSDNVLEFVRLLFAERWAANVHALRWIFPEELQLSVHDPGPFLVLCVNSEGNLGLELQDGQSWLDRKSFRNSIFSRLLLEAARVCPWQPWSSTLWLGNVHRWIRMTLGSPDQITQIRVSSTGAVLKIRVGTHTYFLKSVPRFLSAEIPLLKLLYTKLPKAVPDVLETSPDDCSHITSQINGISLAMSNDRAQWMAAMHGIGAIQRNSVSYVDEMISAGVQHDPFTNATASLEQDVWTLVATQVGVEGELSTFELRCLRGLIEQAEHDCDLLNACHLPDTIVNFDLNESNIFVTETHQTILIDWTFAYVTHPFLTLSGSLFTTDEFSHRMQSAAGELRCAYIQPWLCYTPMDKLLIALGAAKRLLSITTALHVQRCLRLFKDEEPGMVAGISRQLRRALATYGLA